jgi:HicB family
VNLGHPRIVGIAKVISLLAGRDIIDAMRQMLLRVPDELHARLARAARERGTSVNALANEILAKRVPSQPRDDRVRLREKARQLGILVERPRKEPPSGPAWQRALGSTRGIGPVLDEIFADGR